jgi:beta-glucosidase
MVQAKMTFPPDFLWGTATSSHQVEGYNRNNDWWAWEQEPGHILEGHISGAACNWWENAEADLDLAAEMGTNAHRLSLEWSRIEPKPGAFDREALGRYRVILKGMHDRGIEPMVTLHHFSNPLWLVEKGDFSSDIIVDYFRRYSERAVDALGDLVPKWITVNEPMVYLFKRYLNSDFPCSSESGYLAARKAFVNLLKCHASAYHAIKERSPDALISVAKNMPIFEAHPDGSALDKWWAGRVHQIFNDSWMRAMVSGKVPRLFGAGQIKHLAGSFDFTGINYYTRFYVKFPPNGEIIDHKWGSEAVVSDGDYGEVYPYGLYRAIRLALPYRKPIYITENGLPDREDTIRPGFIMDHLRQIWQAISFCFPVMGYYYWSLVDNFEWERGWTQRFGLIALDPETQERRWRQSGHLYREICRSASVSSDMAERYAPHMVPVMFPGSAPSTP